jgi:hypothetical protein
MLFKYFTTVGNTSVAINPNNVVAVRETNLDGHRVVHIELVGGATQQVTDSILDVVARLSERD